MAAALLRRPATFVRQCPKGNAFAPDGIVILPLLGGHLYGYAKLFGIVSVVGVSVVGVSFKNSVMLRLRKWKDIVCLGED